MSMLLGVRGPGRESEGQPVRETIIQQPGSFYNGNPSSSIWGNNPPTPPNWRDSSPANGVFPSSTSTSGSVSSSPSVCGSSMEHQSHWQHVVFNATGELKTEIDKPKDKEVPTTRRAAEFVVRQDRPEQLFGAARPSIFNTPTSPFSFGFPAQSSSINVQKSNGGLDASQIATNHRVSRESLFEGGGGYVFEASSGAHNALKNQNSSSTRNTPATVEFSGQGSTAPYSMENLMKDWESRLHLQGGVLNNLATPANSHHTFKLTEESKSASLETKLPSAACGKAVKSNRPSADNEKLSTGEPTTHVNVDDVPIDSGGSQALPGQKDGQAVFVFGASGTSGTNARAGPSQQKFLNPSGATGMPKSRLGKLKKHSAFTKGKGAGIGGATGVGQAAQEVSRDGSPLSSAGADFNDTSAYDAECSHWSEYDNGPIHESQSTSHWSEPKVTLGLGLDKSSMQSTGHFNRTYSIGSDDNHSFYSLNPSLFMSANKDYQQEEQLHTVSEHLNGWHPFRQQSDENFTRGGSQTRGAIPNLTNLKTTCRPGAADGFVGHEATDDPLSDESIANVIAEMAKCGSPLGKQERPGSSLETCTQEGKTQCPNEASADGINSSERISADSKPYSEFSVEELRQRIAKLGEADPGRNGQKEGQDVPGRKNDASLPFVFRASRQSKATTGALNGDSNFEPDRFVPTFSSINRRNGNVNAAELRNRDKNSNLENLQGPSGAGSATFFNPPTAPMSFEVGCDEKGPYSSQTASFSFGNTSFAEASSSGSHPNLTPFNAMPQASFVKPHNEAPVGEFSGPPSPESSASDSSPPRSEQWSAADGSSFGEHGHFEFRGISKGVHSGASMGKKKARVSSTAWRLGKRSTNRQKKGAQGGSYTTPAKEGAGSPMDFSPCVGEAVPHSKLGLSDTDVEQVWDEWVPSAESQGVEEVRAAAAKLSLNKGQEDDRVHHQEFRFTGEPTGWTSFEFSGQRNAKWKRAAREEGQSTTTVMGNPWANNKNGKEAEYSFITTSNADASSQHGFIFGSDNVRSSLSSSIPLKHFPFSQVEVTRESGKYPDFHGEVSSNPVIGGPNAPGSTVFSRVSEASVSANQGPSHGSSVKGSDASGVFQQSDSGTPSSPSAMKSAAAEQVCERWRLRGNKAYADGDFPKAEECYSRGASSVSPNETSQSCIRASMLCYSNRAATRMAVGRMREALADCMRAMVVDPNFLRVRTRAASCYLALGDSEAAASMFRECLKHAKEGTKPDTKIAAEAMEGIKKAQQVDDYSVRALELLQKENSTDSTAALRLLNEALSISTYSEFLLEMKAQVLFSLRRYEEVVQLCEQSLTSAERNHGTAVIDQQDVMSNEPSSSIENALLKLWRWRMIAKSLFHLGKLEESLDLLLKHEEGLSTLTPEKAASIESLSPLVSTISDLLRHKAAGNEAFQASKHSEAVEHYSAALACNGESRPYNAVCFCNRAAASQALGHIADAIADCSRAIALDPSYPKAISRRATLHEMVRDYGQACNDLQRLVTLLEGYQSHGKNNQSTRMGAQNLNMQDLKQARERLVKAEDDMKKGYPINHYLILGVDSSCSANEIKKAYRKAALKHHPDKAGQFLVRGDNGDDGTLWKEVGEEVRRDAERLFKLIGEAYAILSDPTKRLRYDTEEEHRKLRAKSGSSSVSSTSEGYRSQYEKTSRRQRERWDAWNGYTQYQRWQSGPDAAQPDTYARRSTYAANGSKSGGSASRANDYLWDDL